MNTTPENQYSASDALAGTDPLTGLASPSDDAHSQIAVKLIAVIDRKLTAQLNEIIHQPAFQKLESTWRGLHYLVNQSETGENLKIRVLNC